MVSQAQDRPISTPQSDGVNPRPGFKPSPALLHQMVLLTENPEVDYWVRFGHSQCIQGLTSTP